MSLYVAKILSRFLIDANGPVDSTLMRCLKPIAGSETRLQATPEHLPPTDAHFKLEDIIAGPLEVIPVGRSSMLYEVPEYNELKNLFEVVNKIDRKQLKELSEKRSKNYQKNIKDTRYKTSCQCSTVLLVKSSFFNDICSVVVLLFM